MTRVLHVISSIDPRAGGPSAALEGLARAQLDVGLDVRVLSPFLADFDDSLARSLRNSGVKVDLIGPTRGRLGRHPDLAATVRNAVRDADVVHIHALWEEVQHLAARGAAAQQVPYFMRPCGMLDPWSLSQNRWVKWLYLKLRVLRNLNAAWAVHYTTQAEQRLAEPVGIHTRAVIVPNGVELPSDEPLQDATLTRDNLKIPESAFVVAHFGRLHPKKGIEISIRAAGKIDAPVRPHLLVIGPGEESYINKLRTLAETIGCAENVHFLGMRSGAAKYAVLRLADLFLLPSFQENFGIAVVDAMAVGLPVAISDKVNLWDEILSAGAGEMFTQEPVATAPDRVAAVIRKVMESSDRGLEMGTRGKAYAQEHFTWDKIAAQWKVHYATAIADNPRAKEPRTK